MVNFGMKQIFKGLKELSWCKKTGVLALILVFLYTVIGFFGVPLAFRVMVLSKLNEDFAGKFEADHVRFNPYTWQFKVAGFKGTTSEGEVALSFEEFRINLQPTSVFGDEYKVRDLVLDRPDGMFCIDDEGGINMVSLFEFVGEPKEKKEKNEPFVLPSLVIEHLEVRDAGFGFKIDTLQPSFVREIERLSFVMYDLRTDARHDNDYEFSLVTADGEKLDIKGTVFFDPLSTKGNVSLAAVKLSNYTSFGSTLVDADIQSGELGLSFDYRFRPLAENPEVGIENGSIDLKDFVLVEKGGGPLIHQVGSMRVKGVEFDVVNRAVGFDTLALGDASFLVTRDRSGAFQVIKKAESKKRANGLAKGHAKQPNGIQIGVVAADQDMGVVFAKALEQMGSFTDGVSPIAMEFNQGVIQDSSIRFRDQSMKPGADLGVLIAELSAGPYASKSGRPVNVKAILGMTGSAKGRINVDGSLVPMTPLKSTEVAIGLTGVSMSAFADYAVPAIGRPLEGGTIDADLNYRIKDGAIEATNQLKIAQLKLGSRVEGSEAPNLPLDLAIAILEDRERVIQLDVPMSGNVNDPKFSMGRMVTYAFQNVIEKIVTTPFNALSGLIPGEGVGDSSFAFERGTSKMVDGCDELVDNLAKVMVARPQLVIQLTPTYVSGKDAKELRDKRFETAVQAIVKNGKDRKDAIKQLHEALPKEQQAGGWPFKKLEDMEKAVRSSMLVANDRDGLSEKRANAVKGALLNQDGIKASRIQIKKPVEAETARVDFSVGAAPY